MKLKKTYIMIIILLVISTMTFYFSYAFFTNKVEGNGKLNIIAGTLDYKIESSDLEDNQITLAANSIKTITVNINSLNDISSKYELYYKINSNSNDVIIGYDEDSLSTGVIDKGQSKKINVIIRNNSSSNQTITFGVRGGLVNNDLALGDSETSLIDYCSLEQTYTFDYTGSYQEFNALCSGDYKVELWGAGGGIAGLVSEDSGKGGYTSGTIELEKDKSLYVYVGEQGKKGSYGDGNGNAGLGAIQTFNGGGAGGIGGTGTEEYPSNKYTGGPSGGGATDIRLTSGSWDNFESLKSRIMVAGGGGSYNAFDDTNVIYKYMEGSNNLGLIGEEGAGIAPYTTASGTLYDYTNRKGKGGTQTTGYQFGIGGTGYNTGSNYALCPGHGGGGGGYYGGTGGQNTNGDCFIIGGGAGSSFISGHKECDAIANTSTKDNIIHTGQANHYSGYIFTDTMIIEGTDSNMPTHDGSSTMKGNSGNGYAKITYLGESSRVYDTYKIGDEVTLSDGSKWHVLEVSGSDSKYVTLLSDYNLNSDGTYNDECGRDIDGTYRCNTMAFNSAGANNYNVSDIKDFIDNIYAPTLRLSGTTNITLPTADQIAAADGLIFNEEALDLTSSWLLTTNYWTISGRNTTDDLSNDIVFLVAGQYSRISQSYATDSDYCGVRPVITTLKANIIDTMDEATALSIGTSVTAVDGSKWHVLEASGSDNKYVTLLSDYNLNDDGSYNTECRRDISGTGVCSNRVFSVGAQGIYDETNSDNIGYFIKNTYAPLLNSLLETTNITLPTAEQILKADSKEFSQFPDTADENAIILSHNWLTDLSYWTKTISDVHNKYVYVILSNNKFFLRYYSSNSYGARPVITTLKTNLLNN